jgi:hypothetical protein
MPDKEYATNLRTLAVMVLIILKKGDVQRKENRSKLIVAHT